MHKHITLLVSLALFALPGAASARMLDLKGYAEPNGAITSYYKGDYIDPYFAIKALLLAKDSGLEVRGHSASWIKWALKAQRGDGLFNRYRRDEGSNWIVYYPADADDALLAMWLELLYRTAPDSGMPAQWKDSAQRAQAQLDALFDKKQDIYHISRGLPVGLLMDNTEIYASFRQIEKHARRLNMYDEASRYAVRAAVLREGILKTFQRKDGSFAITTQERSENSFYPDKVAQLYPLLYGVFNKKQSAERYKQWMNTHGNEWLNMRHHDYPWGLVAAYAVQQGDMDAANCWASHAEPNRFVGRWNLLEEVALQSIKQEVEETNYTADGCAKRGW